MLIILIQAPLNIDKISLNVGTEVTKKEQEISVILVNDWYNLFLYVVDECFFTRFSNKSHSG